MNLHPLKQQQLEEITALQSIFGDDFTLDDDSVFNETQDLVENCLTISQQDLGICCFSFLINVQNTCTLVVTLPHDYPSSPPNVSIRSPLLSQQMQRLLHDKLHDVTLSLAGNQCIFQLTEWLKDNIQGFIPSRNQQTPKATIEHVSALITLPDIFVFQYHQRHH